MHIVKTGIVSGLASVLLTANLAYAKVSQEEADRLGKDLTPFGGEVAGNADGSIPAWNPKWKGFPPGMEYEKDLKRPNPYEDEKPILIITADNYQEHKDNLTEGQQALFARYPHYRMEVYPSHRDFGFNDRIAKKVKRNATHTELVNNNEGVGNFVGGPAFPIPQSGQEVLWNSRTNGCQQTMHVHYDGYGVFANGERAHDAVDYRTSNPFNNPDLPWDATEEVVGDRVVHTLTARTAPVRKKGQLTAVQDPLDYKANKRNAWTYDPGTRRVRKAPAIGYDNPDGPGGLQTIDDHKGYNGAFDRFDYTLLGKKEIYIPYHNYKYNNPKYGTLDDRLTKNFPNPEYVRFEKHRVWAVEGNLAEGKRHAYKKRRWYLDEDSWNPVLSENFDGRGNLWRVGLFLSDYQYAIQCYEKHTQAFMDLPSGHYVTNWITLNRKDFDHSLKFMTKDKFTPANLRKAAKR